MAEIKTLVYFDLEATGLKSSGRPRISELSFVAIEQAHHMCVPYGYYNARGFQHYWFGQLQSYWSG